MTPLLTNVQDNSSVSMQTSRFQSQTKTCAPTISPHLMTVSHKNKQDTASGCKKSLTVIKLHLVKSISTNIYRQPHSDRAGIMEQETFQSTAQLDANSTCVLWPIYLLLHKIMSYAISFTVKHTLHSACLHSALSCAVCQHLHPAAPETCCPYCFQTSLISIVCPQPTK